MLRSTKHSEIQHFPSFALPYYQVPRFSTPVLLAAAIERLYNLNVGTTPVQEGAPHEKPHKPLLLMAALDLIDEGHATPDHIPWSQQIRDRFTARFEIVRKYNDQNNPDLPFRYLAGDGFWKPLEADGVTLIRRDILVADIGQVFARFTDGFEFLVAIPENRRKMREALVARYFPHHAAALLSMTGGNPNAGPGPSKGMEDETESGRGSAFRRKILEIYDHQCVACGLRIKLPTAYDVSFIDAAHLVPFSNSRNDHPTNGLALCKNHHWAMDRNLIAPCPDHHWHVSAVLDPRRSTGEAELISLSGKSLLLPQDPAFYPDTEGLNWRCEQLIA